MESEKYGQIYVGSDKTLVRVGQGQSALEALLDSRIDISHSCGGNGTCGTCRIVVTEGHTDLPLREELEREMAEDRDFKENERLACQIQVEHKIKCRTN